MSVPWELAAEWSTFALFSHLRGEGQNNQWKPNLLSMLAKDWGSRGIYFTSVNVALFEALFFNSLITSPDAAATCSVVSYTCTATLLDDYCPKNTWVRHCEFTVHSSSPLENTASFKWALCSLCLWTGKDFAEHWHLHSGGLCAVHTRKKDSGEGPEALH